MIPPLKIHPRKEFLPSRDDFPLKIHLGANVLSHIFIFPAREHHFLSSPGSINICIKSGNSRIAIKHILL